MNDYINRLYGWISSTDSAFGETLTVEDFEEKLQDEDYATRMYTWIAETDPNFQKELSLEFFINKVKKKDISFEPSITTNIEEAGLSEEIQETEPVQPPGDSTEEDINLEETEEESISIPPQEEQSDSADIEDKEESFQIESTEVDPETFEEYAELQEQQTQEDADPFNLALNQLDLDYNESFLVPKLNYEFGQYGFKFSEAAPGRDAVMIESADGEKLMVGVNTKNPGSTKIFKDFLIRHKKENKKLDEIEERIAIKRTKFLNEQQIKNSIKILDMEAEALNSRIKNYTTSSVELYKLNEYIKSLSVEEVNSPEGIALRLKRNQLEARVKDEKIYIIQQDAELSNRGSQIDRLAGDYLSMKSQQGDFLGITQKAVLKGSGKQTSFITDLMTDILISDYSPFDALAGGTTQFGMRLRDYQNLFRDEAMRRGGIKDDNGRILYTLDDIKEAQEDGRFTPYESFEDAKSSIDPAMAEEIDDYIKDIGRKMVKYDNIEMKTQEDGSVKPEYKRPQGSARYSDEALKLQLGDLYQDGMVELTRNGLDLVLGDKDTTNEYYDLTKEGFWGGAWLGLGESLPAMLGGPGKFGWAQRTAQMFAQVENSLKEEMQNDPDFAEISENERRAVSVPIGIVVGTLEAVGLRNIANQKGLINNILLKSLQKYGPQSAARTRGLTFQQVVRNEVDNMLLKGTLVVGAAGAAEFETGLSQEIVDIAGKTIYNEMKEKDMFQTPESFADGLRQVLRAGAQEMIGGFVMGTMPATATAFAGRDYEALSDPLFKTFEAISQDATLFKLNIQKIKDQINSGKKTKAQGQAEIDLLNEIRGIIPKVPKDLKVGDRKRVVGLLLSKQDLVRKREQTAPELRGRIDKEIGKVDKLLSDIIEGAENIDPTIARVEEEEITDEQAIQFIKDQNESNKFFGIVPLEINAETISMTKDNLKKQRDASKKQSPVPKTGEIESQTTEEVVEGVPNELQESARESEQEAQGEVAPQEEAQVEQEVQDIQEFEGDTDVVTPESDFGVQEETEVKTENITKDGKVKTTKSETKVETKAFEPVIRFSKRAARAISKILPKVNIVLHESSANFNKATGKTGRGFYNPTDQTIHIDLTKGNNKTVAHEVFHALLLNSVKTNAQARAVTKRMVAAVAKAKGLTTQQKKKIDDFISNYDQDIQNEEKLAEILGVLADGYTKLDAPNKSRIRRWIESIAKRLGIDIEQFTKTDQDVIDLLNTVAGKLAQGQVITKKDVKALKPPTQKEQVTEVLGEMNVASIKEITEATGLPEPTVRRILGQGAKNGELTRVSAGVYTLKTKSGKTVAIVQGADARTEIKRLVEEGAKFDMIFLDPPYKIPKGGKKGTKTARDIARYEKIPPQEFGDFVKDVVKLLRNDNSPVLFMFSMGISKQTVDNLKKYTKALVDAGLINTGVAAETGKLAPIKGTILGYRGKPMKEMVYYYTRSGKTRQDLDVKFEKEYYFKKDTRFPSAKPVALLEAIIEASTKAGEIILDPFAGSGSTARAAVRKGRSVVTIEKDKQYAKDVKAKVKEEQQKKKQEGDQLDIFEGREQKEVRDLGERFMMNIKGFISPRALYDTSRLRSELERLGLRLGTARNEFTGEITGYYFQKVSKRGKPYFFNPFRRQQKDIDKAAGNLNDIASTVVRLRDNNFSPEAIRDYLVGKKKFNAKEVDAIMSVSNFVLTRVPESFGKIPGGVLQGLRFFSKLNKFRENLINNNLTPFGKRMSKLNQELEVLKSKKGKNEAAIKSIENKMERLKERNPGAKLFKFTQTEITDKVINYMKNQKEYKDASPTKDLSTLQAQMEMQIAKSFYATPSVNMAQQIRIARGIVGKTARETNDLDRIKASLRNYIRAVLPPVEYDKPQILDLIKKIQGATKDNIKDVKQDVLNLAVGKVVNTLDNKITKLLKTNFAKVEAGRRKANVVDAQAIKILESIRDEFADIKSKTPDQIIKLIESLENKVKKLQEQTDQTESNFAEQNKFDIILNYASAMLMEDTDVNKVSELNNVLTDLNLIVTEGKGALEQQKRDMYHRYLKDFEIAWQSITGNKIEMLIKNPDYDPQLPISKSNEQLIVNPKAKDLIRKFSKLTDAKKNASKNFVSRTLDKVKNRILNYTVQKRMDLPSIIEYMTKLPGEMFEGEFAEITSDAINESSNRYKLFTMQDKAALEDILKKSYGKKWMDGVKKDSLVIDTGIAINLEEYNEAKKNYDANPSKENKAILDTTTLRLQPLQMAYLVYQYKDPANKESFETKYGEQYERIMFQMEELLEANHQPVIQLAEWMVNEAYPSLYNRYNEVYKAIYRVDMPWNQFYIGPIRREGQEVADVNLGLDGQGSYAGMGAPDYSKVRIQNKRPVADQNLLENYVAYGDKMNWFAGYGENFNRISKLFNNPDIEKIIRTEYPEGSYDVVKGIIDRIAVKGISNQQGLDALFNTATSLFVVGRLGVNPTIFLKQLVSFPTYVNEIGVTNWTKHAALGVGQINATFKEIMDNSVYIQDRYSRDFIRSIETYKNASKGSEYDPNRSKFKLFTNPFQQLLNVQMYLVKQGDKGAIMIGGIPVYNYHKSEFKKKNPGATEQEAIDYAIKRFEKATRTTQQSTDLQNRDYYQDGGVVARTLNMFKTSIIQYLRKEILYATNMYRILRGQQGRGGYGKIRNFYESAKGLLVYHSVLPVLFQYLSAGLPGVLAPWDEEDGEDLTRAAIIGNLNAVFLLGDILTKYADYLQDKPWARDFNFVSIPLIDQTREIFKKRGEYMKTAAKAKEYYDKGDYVKGDEIKSKADQLLFELFVEDIPGASGINSKSLVKWYKNIETLITEDEDPRVKLLRLFNFSDYQILSEEDRKPEKRQRGGLTQAELKKFFPDLYEEQQNLKEKYKISPKLQRQIDELKAEQKRLREEALEKMTQ